MPEISTLALAACVAAAPGSTPGVAPATELIPLRAAFGQDEANHGTAQYPVDADGIVRVPREAVEPLTSKGGFAAQATSADLISVGMVTVHHENAAGCSYLGRQYPGDKNGDVRVPAEAVSELIAHGFVSVLPGTGLASRRAEPSPSHRPEKV
jgi:hypothetical protein